jgi:ATP adenylyltransferase
MDTLFTPWRYSYITQTPVPPEEEEGCFFCAAARDPHAVEAPEGLVVAKTGHHLVMLNLHPYASGHLMVAPLAHFASPQEEDEAGRAEFWPLVLKAQRLLAGAYAPHGFNLGMNLGKPAGAGVPGHFHFHLVPRWTGDTNFMPILTGTRTISEGLSGLYQKLIDTQNELEKEVRR